MIALPWFILISCRQHIFSIILCSRHKDTTGKHLKKIKEQTFPSPTVSSSGLLYTIDIIFMIPKSLPDISPAFKSTINKVQSSVPGAFQSLLPTALACHRNNVGWGSTKTHRGWKTPKTEPTTMSLHYDYSRIGGWNRLWIAMMMVGC